MKALKAFTNIRRVNMDTENEGFEATSTVILDNEVTIVSSGDVSWSVEDTRRDAFAKIELALFKNFGVLADVYEGDR